MKRLPVLFAALCTALFFTPKSAFAINCLRASSFADKAICGDEDLKIKDAALNAAYLTRLNSTKDRNIHDMLIFSQRRWLEARERQFSANSSDYKKEAATFLAMEIEDRQNDLSASAFIQRVETAKRFSSQYTGGEYAGNEITCFFAPPGFGNGAYECIGSITFQHYARICRLAVDWASNHTTNYQTIGSVTKAGAKIIATCSVGYATTDEPCPSQNKNKPIGWNFQPKPNDLTPILKRYGNHSAEPAYDPDFWITPPDEEWLNACLTNPNYPFSQPVIDGVK